MITKLAGTLWPAPLLLALPLISQSRPAYSLPARLSVLPLGAFKLYDVDNDGYITREEMYDIVGAIYEMLGSAKRDGLQSSDATSDESPNVRVDRIFELLDQVSWLSSGPLDCLSPLTCLTPCPCLRQIDRIEITSCLCRSSRRAPSKTPRLSKRSLYMHPDRFPLAPGCDSRQKRKHALRRRKTD